MLVVVLFLLFLVLVLLVFLPLLLLLLCLCRSPSAIAAMPMRMMLILLLIMLVVLLLILLFLLFINTGEFPVDEWLEADIRSEDVRLNFSIEEQLIYNRLLTPITITTDTTSLDYGEQNPLEMPETLPGYDEKVAALSTHLDCRFKLRSVRWQKTAKECRPVHLRAPLGCPGPWIV